MAPQWKASFINNHHAYGAIVTANKSEFDSHPEYYALVKGERKGSKLCISNTNVLPLAVKYAVEYFRKTPFSFCVSMEPTDGYGWCECVACTNMGSPSDRAVFLANTVARTLEKEYPDKYVGMLAYAQHAEPPKIAVHPRVVVSVATHLSGNIPVEKRLKGWGAAAKTLGIYDYYAVAQWHLSMPAKSLGANLPYLTNSIPLYHTLGARVMVAEAGDCWGPCGLGYYVASRLLWRVQDATNLAVTVDDFLNRSFGPAREPMREFYSVIDGSQAKPGTPDFFAERATRMYNSLLKARKLLKSQEQRSRVEDLLLYTRYVELVINNWRARDARPGENAEQATARKRTALEELIRWARKIQDTGMGHWVGVANVIEGAKTVDIGDVGAVTPQDIEAAWAAAQAFTRR